MEFKRAIVREPADSYKKCISSHPLHSSLDIEKAREQHRVYQKTLRDLGLEIIMLPRENTLPDSCFVEDTVVIHGNKGFITRIGAESRRGEENAVETILRDYKQVHRATSPATIDGGDVVHLEDRLISGLSTRTNLEGIKQAKEWLEVPIDYIEDHSIVHLKSYITYLGNNTILATSKYLDHPLLQDFDTITVPDDELYAANTLTINEHVLIPYGYPKTHELLVSHGFEVVQLKMDQFMRCEGALTCLSILF